MALLVEALAYKPEGRVFDYRRGRCDFMDLSFWPYYGHGSNQTVTQLRTSKGGRCLELTSLPPSCVNCLEILHLQLPGGLRAVQAYIRIASHYANGESLYPQSLQVPTKDKGLLHERS